MTYDMKDIENHITKQIAHIQAINGERTNVDSVGTIEVASKIRFKTCLVIPNLSHKLLSISQFDQETKLYCFHAFWYFIAQDDKQTIGSGIDWDGLYYVDKVTQKGQVVFAHRSTEKHL